MATEWSDSNITATEYKTTGTVTYYYRKYNSETKSYEWYVGGQLSKGAKLGLTYNKKTSAMKIVTSSKSLAGSHVYYIRTADNITVTKDKNGKTVKASTEATKTTDSNTGKTVAKNTDKDGNTSGSSVSSDEEASENYLDDAFVEESYGNYSSSSEYDTSLFESLQIEDLRGIMGMPHQFIPLADPRINGDASTTSVGSEQYFGRTYSEKIIKQIPLLLMTPGTPAFMTQYSEEQKTSILGKLTGVSETSVDNLINGKSGKYYSLKYAYTEYFKYVNAMLRSAAYFLGIENETINSKKLGTKDWLWETSSLGNNIFGHGKLENFLGPYAGCIPFYADCGNSVGESFSNQTTESQLASALNSLSDSGRELNFLVGNVSNTLNVNTGYNELQDQMSNIASTIEGLNLGGGNIFSNIINKAVTILAGGRMMFPEIWSDSSFGRSYSCSMKLVSPSGDKLSVFLNILVPLYHLLAFTMPRQSIDQSYYSPFLVRAYSKGLFNVDMGIITSLSVEKGAEGEWTVDGIPTVCNISFDIKDLYDAMFMSKQESVLDDTSIMSNIQELDYIANTCGVNVNDQEVGRTIKMYGALGFSELTDKITVDVFGGVNQWVNQKVQNIFGVF